jgi:hypothetical protein
MVFIFEQTAQSRNNILIAILDEGGGMERTQNALAGRALLLALHRRAVAAARRDATASYGSVTSRKWHFAWRAEEAKFADSLEKALLSSPDQQLSPAP